MITALRGTYVPLLAAAALVAGFTVALSSPSTAGAPTGTHGVKVTVIGLPAGLSPHFFVDEELSTKDGYRRNAGLALAADSTTTVPSGAIVEAAIVDVDKFIRYRATNRFQSSNADALTFTFQREYFLTMSKWSRGPAAASVPDQVMGDISLKSRWVAAGDTVLLFATPRPGWRFAQWGVFEAGERADQTRVSASMPALSVKVDRALHVVAGFLPVTP